MPPNTACNYLKLALTSPVVVGACPLTLEPEAVRQMVTSGAGAIVLPSVFQEQLTEIQVAPTDPASAYLAECRRQQQTYNRGPDSYLTSIQTLKQLVSIPVIGSLNGYCDGDWLDFARRIQAAGADALELNVQPIVANVEQTSQEIEEKLLAIVRRVCASVSIPVGVKMTRHYTSVANMAQRFGSAGAAGIVMFAHETHWEVAINRLHWTPNWELTPVESLAATLGGIIQARVGGLELPIAASGGIRAAEDAIKVMIAGADVVMITSEIYRAGPSAIAKIVRGIERCLETGGFDSLASFQQTRPSPEIRPQCDIRHDYLDPLTRSTHYVDPTPVVEQKTGDRYGHRDV
jgi:dihydroorotate dehydrogenase (fumarate)